jgi:hypothetical protein
MTTTVSVPLFNGLAAMNRAYGEEMIRACAEYYKFDADEATSLFLFIKERKMVKEERVAFEKEGKSEDEYEDEEEEDETNPSRESKSDIKKTIPYKNWTTHDDWMTPRSAWEDINQYIPRDRRIWEAFYGNGQSGKHLTGMGFDTIHEDIDFFENDEGDVVVSNPPFTLIPTILKRLVEINKPFILIMPSSKINTQYFRKIFNNDNPIQIIVPKKRIHFLKMVDGVVDAKQNTSCAFDCHYYCWKMNLPRDIIWL